VSLADTLAVTIGSVLVGGAVLAYARDRGAGGRDRRTCAGGTARLEEMFAAPTVRASDAEREAVARRLTEAAGEGRITLEEHGARVEVAYAARTRADLVVLLSDLPVPGTRSALRADPRDCRRHAVTLSPITFRLGRADRGGPLEQLVGQVERGLQAGYLRAGDPLPTVTDAAGFLAINPVIVFAAYRELERRGVARPDPGQGTFVVTAQGVTALTRRTE
jgi:hypothetical protein